MSSANELHENHPHPIRQRLNRQAIGDFDPKNIPPHIPRAEDRMVAALEYAAVQLGQINRRLGRLMELTEDLRERD